MNKKEKSTDEVQVKHFEKVRPIELKRIIQRYGMTQTEYCNLRGKSRIWWNNVLEKRKHVKYTDIEVFIKHAGEDTFNMLLAEVRKQHAPQEVENEKRS
jgi:hypothetical protein